MGHVGFHRTVPLVLNGTAGIGRTHRIEGVDGTGKIPLSHLCYTGQVG